MLLDITPLLRSVYDTLPFTGECGTEIGWDGMGEAITWNAPILLSGKAFWEGDNLRLLGNMHLDYRAVCGRCLEPMAVTADIPFDEVFSASADETAEEGYSFRGHILDPQDMVDDLILLHMPMRHLCAEDCKGLCPVCGVNLNKNHCNCAVTPEPAPNPFAVLNKLQTQEDEEV